MRKTKLLLVAFLAMLGSSVYADEYDVDTRFTSVAALNDQLFAIVNETEEKAIYNSNNQNLEYKDYATAVTGAAYLWKIHSLSAESDENVISCYTVEAVKADGSSITIWDNRTPLVLNSGKEGGFNGCFVLNNGTQYGTDDQYCGIWEIAYVDGQGFTLKNKKRGGYFSGKDAAPTGDTPIYWTFCTLKKLTEAESARKRYNKVKALILSVNNNVDISNAESLASSDNAEVVESAIPALYTALANYLTNSGSNDEVTSVYVVNPSFEDGLSGWTNNGMANQGNTSFEKDGVIYCEAWQPNGTKSVSQVIKGLPLGKYRLSAKSKARGVASAKLYAGKVKTAIEISDNTKAYNVEFVCNDQITIGFEGVGTGAGNSWLCVDNFQLTYVAPATEQDLADFNFAVEKGIFEETLDAAKTYEENTSIPTAAKNTLHGVIDANDKTFDTTEEYTAAIANLNNAVAAANQFVKPYADFKTLKANADDLVSAGTDNPTGQSTLSGVITTQSNNVEAATTAEAVNAAFTALKGQMTTYANSSNPLGKDAQFNITFMLTNPDLSKCEGWKPADGWYNDQNQPTQNSQVMNTNQSVAYQKDKTKYAMYEYWSNSTEPTEGYVVYQKVTLPEGTYKMAALAFAGFGGGHRYGNRTDGDHSLGSLGEGEPNITFSAGDTDGTKITTTTLDDASIEFVQKQEGEVKIGLRAHAENRSNWMGIGYVELFKVPMRAIDLDEDAAYEPENIAGAVTLKKRLYPGWNTVVLPFGVSADLLSETFGGGELYKYTGDKNGVLQFAEATAIAPHTPYLFKSNAGDGSKRTMNFDAVTISTGTPITAGTNYDFVGTYAPLNRAIYETDYLLVPGKFQKGNGRNSLNAFRAYIRGKVESEARELLISIDGVTTAIEVVNGKSVDSNSPIYNLAGQRVKSAQKGLYIQGGKKFVK